MLTLIVYEREQRALGSFLAPSARGAASCSSRRFPESLSAQLRPPGSPCWPPVTDGGLKGKEERNVGRLAGAEGRDGGMGDGTESSGCWPLRASRLVLRGQSRSRPRSFDPVACEAAGIGRRIFWERAKKMRGRVGGRASLRRGALSSTGLYARTGARPRRRPRRPEEATAAPLGAGRLPGCGPGASA